MAHILRDYVLAKLFPRRKQGSLKRFYICKNTYAQEGINMIDHFDRTPSMVQLSAFDFRI